MADHHVGLTVAQMSAATGVTPHTLRYYERVGLIRPVARTSGGQRRYSSADVAWVAFLLRLRATGMPIAHVREYASLRERGSATTRLRLELLETHQARVREQIRRLRGHEQALAQKITGCRAVLGTAPETPTRTAGAHPQEGSAHD